MQLTLKVSTTDYSVITPDVAKELRNDFELFMRDLETGQTQTFDYALNKRTLLGINAVFS